MTPNLWDFMSSQLFGLNRNFIKQQMHALSYGADIDPWLKHFFDEALHAWARRHV